VGENKARMIGVLGKLTCQVFSGHGDAGRQNARDGFLLSVTDVTTKTDRVRIEEIGKGTTSVVP
jgi:hypothetical protein